ALERDLVVGRADPAGPWLLPAPSSPAELWAAATSTWPHVGLGAHATADPFAALLAGLGALAASPDHVVRLLLVAGVPLAARLGRPRRPPPAAARARCRRAGGPAPALVGGRRSRPAPAADRSGRRRRGGPCPRPSGGRVHAGLRLVAGRGCPRAAGPGRPIRP